MLANATRQLPRVRAMSPAPSLRETPVLHPRATRSMPTSNAACLTNWHQRHDQLTAGAFDGVFEEFCFGRVRAVPRGLRPVGASGWRGVAWLAHLRRAGRDRGHGLVRRQIL